MQLPPPKVPPRTHPIHLRNQRLRTTTTTTTTHRTLSPETHQNPTSSTSTSNSNPFQQSDDVCCHSRKASSVGFVEIDDLLKFQEEYKRRSPSGGGGGLCSSLRHIFFSSTSSEGVTSSGDVTTSSGDVLVESHINPMFSHHKLSISRSYTHLPYPPKKKRKSHLRRVFSCFSIFKQ